jgi:Raf kinase inhibitor-like YbhB/YbcL family protein
MALELTSPAFTHEGEIPALYTCDGEDRSAAPALYTRDEEDRSPALNWSGLPAGTRSLALIMAESDSPASARMACVHWILYDLPSHSTGLTDGARPQDLPTGSRPGLNDWKHVRYDGPCSPIERRRYLFELYALDAALPDLNCPTRAQLQRAMQGHVLGQVGLAGTYQRHP